MEIRALTMPRAGMAARALALSAAAVLMLGTAQARGASGVLDAQAGQPVLPSGNPPFAASLEACVTSVVQAERSATFAGEMTAIPGTKRMAMRIDLEERMAGELLFRTVSAPGLGRWRSSDPKVKVYKDLEQVTNLSAPAVYRAIVRFHWLNGKGRLIRRAEHVTSRCLQPAAPPSRPPTGSEAPPSAASPSTPA